MNWPAVAAAFSALTFVIVLIGGGVLWGTLTEKVSGLSKRADSHGKELAMLDRRVNGLDVEVAKLQEWKAGYNAAARVGGKTAEV